MLALAVVSACAAPPGATDLSLPDSLPTRASVADVPLIVQDAYYCGPAALAMALGAAGIAVGQEEVAALAFTPGAQGSFQSDMTGAARRLGALAVPVGDLPTLFAEVAAGRPVIVFQNLGLPIAPVWHYGVVTGYDRAAGTVTLHSGEREVMVMPFDAFRLSWARGEDWGLLALAPGDLPATVPSEDVLAAAAALEGAERFAEAEAAYRAGMARWPGEWLWPFGLANARYAQGDLAGARAALLEARRRGPEIPEVRANLDFVTAELNG